MKITKHIALVTVLLAALAGCTAAPASLQPTATPRPSDLPVRLTWTQTQAGECRTARFDDQGLDFGPCGVTETRASYSLAKQMDDLAFFTQTYASFNAATRAGVVHLAGEGSQAASPAEQRAVTEWARLLAGGARTAASGQPADSEAGLALSWRRTGGLLGLCEDLSIFASGEVDAATCQASKPVRIGRYRLSAEQLAQLYPWLDALQGYSDRVSEPGVADAPAVHITFNGRGDRPATPVERQALLDFAAAEFAIVSRPK